MNMKWTRKQRQQQLDHIALEYKKKPFIAMQKGNKRVVDEAFDSVIKKLQEKPCTHSIEKSNTPMPSEWVRKPNGRWYVHNPT